MSVTSKCSPLVAFNLDPHCGILPTCYQNALNKQVLSNMSCARKKNGKPGVYINRDSNISYSLFIYIFFIDFLTTRKGECPTDKPPCPPNILE